MNIRNAVQQLSSLIEDKAHEYVKADWLIWWLSDGQRAVAKRTLCLKNSSTASGPSVASQGAYSLPTRCIGIDRVYYAGYPIDPITREEMDRTMQDSTDASETSVKAWEDEEGTVERWIYDRHANKIRLVAVPKVAGSEIRILYSELPEEFINITATTNIPEFADEAMFLYALINAQRHISVKYESDKQLRQAQVWQNHARINEAKYEHQIQEIKTMIQGFQNTNIIVQQGVGMEFEEDRY